MDKWTKLDNLTTFQKSSEITIYVYSALLRESFRWKHKVKYSNSIIPVMAKTPANRICHRLFGSSILSYKKNTEH